jgi:hypothetical protein
MSDNDYGWDDGNVSRVLITSENDGPREGSGRTLLVVLVEVLKERKVKGKKSATRSCVHAHNRLLSQISCFSVAIVPSSDSSNTNCAQLSPGY